MSKNNIRKAFDNARDKIAGVAVSGIFSAGVSAVGATMSLRRNFEQFTGNTFNAFSVTAYNSRGPISTYRTDDVGLPLIRSKVPYRTKVHLSNPVEGDERSVKGRVPLISESVLTDNVISAPRRAGGMGVVRLAAAIEYKDYLEFGGDDPVAALWTMFLSRVVSNTTFGRMRMGAGSLDLDVS